jgi:hypothetical protein
MIRVFRTGRHSRRTPLSYPALASLYEGRIEQVDRPEQADLYVFAHVLDIQNAPIEVVSDWRLRRRPVVLLSEEPFWETIWGRQPLDRHIVVETDFGALPVIQLNHFTSDIYRFNRIPYYLLTNPRFTRSYAERFARNAAFSAQEWQIAFSERQQNLTFMFERRPEPYHNVRFPDGDIIGLCAWRTDLASLLGHAEAEKLGQSWQGGQTRFEIKDWHADKLALLDGRARIIGAFENTHQPDYVTEKWFDAFACGAMPLYFASPWHRIHGFGIPQESWLNLYDLSPEEAAHQIRNVRFGPTFFSAFAEAQQRLYRMFKEEWAVSTERIRISSAVLKAFEEILS